MPMRIDKWSDTMVHGGHALNQLIKFFVRDELNSFFGVKEFKSKFSIN